MLNYVLNRDIKSRIQTTAVVNETTNTIELYDTIISEKYWDDQPGITANEFVNQLGNLKGDILVRINSKGGEVGNALAIYQRLREHKGVVSAVVDGYAYSSAGWILLAAEKRTINTGGLVMVHNPAMYAEITKESDFDEAKNQWVAHQNSIINIISERTPLKKDEVKNMMEKTTFMTAQQAITNGFCHAIQNTFDAFEPAVKNAMPAEVTNNFKLKGMSVEDCSLIDRSLVARMRALN